MRLSSSPRASFSRCAAPQPCSRPLRAALRSRPSCASFAHRTLPPFVLLPCAHIRRRLSDNQISGTIPDALGQLTKLNILCVSLLLPAPRRRAASPRSLLAPSARRASFALFTRVVRSPRSPSLRSPSLRAHSQGLERQPDQRHHSRRARPAHEAYSLVRLSSPPRASSSRCAASQPARALRAPRFVRALHARRSLTALSPLRSPSLRAHSQKLEQQPDHGCCIGHLRHQGPPHLRLRPLPQSGLDERRDVPGVPQLWTVHASRHVHCGGWKLHPITDALADALTHARSDNTRADVPHLRVPAHSRQ